MRGGALERVDSIDRRFRSGLLWPFRFQIGCSLFRVLQVTFLSALFSTQLFATNFYNNDRHHGGPSDNPWIEFDGGDGPGACGVGMPNYWVNTSNLNLVVEDTDFAYAGLGPAVEMKRIYNSSAGNWGVDPAWRNPFESSIIWDSGQSVWELHRISGQVIPFEKDAAVQPPYNPKPVRGYYNELTYYGSYFILEEKASWIHSRYDLADSPKNEWGSPISSEYYRLTQITDPYGNAVTFVYNESGKIKEVIDAAGRKTTFDYDANGHQKSMTTPDGRRAEYEYDANGYLLRSIDLLGTETTYTYASTEWKTMMTSFTAGGKTVQFNWDDDGDLESVTDSRGHTTQWSWAYGDYARTSPNGHKTEFWTADDFGLSSGILGSNGHFQRRRGYYWGTSFGTTSHDMLPDVETVLRELPDGSYSYTKGFRRIFHWDENGNLTKLIIQDHASERPDRTYQFEYATSGDLTREIDPLGHIWRYEWNDKHRLIRMESPQGAVTQFSYDSKGNLTEVRDARSNSTSFSYDMFGNVTTVTDALGKKTQFGYGNQGLQPASVTDPRGFTTQIQFDANDRLTRVTHPDSTQRSFAYDCCSGSSTTDENGNTQSYVRDAQLNVTRFLDALSHATGFTYDPDRNLTETVDPLGSRIQHQYDQMNWVAKTTDPSAGEVSFEYDEVGNLKALSDQKGNRTSFEYTDVEQLNRVTDPTGKTTSYDYDPLERISQITNARGQRIGYSYSADGFLQRKTYGSSSVAAYEYDLAGNLTQVTDAWGKTQYQYNARDEVTRIQYPSGKTAGFSYDASGNLESVTYPGDFKVNYQYDSRDRPTRVSWNGGFIELTYDAAGNLLGIDRSNGTQSRYAYDKNDRFLRIRHGTEGDDWVDLQFIRDAAGRTTGESRVVPLSDFHEPALTGVSVNDANQLTGFGKEMIEYDADGNLVRVGNRFSAVYDLENRPISITRDGVATDHTYDALGNRVVAEREIWKRQFHYDHFGNLLFETDGTGDVTVAYILIGDFLLARRSGSHDTFYLFDSRGSTLALTDSDGEIVAAYAYDPYGKVTHRSGSIYNPFTYAGAFGVMDEGEGLFFMRNRHYDATLQRFLQKDPIGFAGGINLYAYVEGNPVERVDPHGLQFGLVQMNTLIKGAGLAPGSTGAAWLRGGFYTTTRREGFRNVTRLISRTFNPTRGAHLARLMFETHIKPLLSRSVATVAAGAKTSTVTSCAIAGTAALVGWGVTGLVLEKVGQKTGMTDVEAVGMSMNQVTVSAINKAKRVAKDFSYFVRGLGVKLGLQNP